MRARAGEGESESESERASERAIDRESEGPIGKGRNDAAGNKGASQRADELQDRPQ